MCFASPTMAAASVSVCVIAPTMLSGHAGALDSRGGSAVGDTPS